MRFYAKMNSTQTGTEVFRFGYKIDASEKIFWKEGNIKSVHDFKRTIQNELTNSSKNIFDNLCLWIDISNDRGIRQMFSNVNTTFFEVILSAQDDLVTTSKPATVKFMSPTLTHAVPSLPPSGQMKAPLTQILSFTFEKSLLVNF